MACGSRRAQTEVVGVALLLGLTLLGTTAVVLFGGAALSETRNQAQNSRAEQSMSLFDSQVAQVALGNSAVQTVNFGYAEGTYQSTPTAGEISILQLDCDDNKTNDDGNKRVTDPGATDLSVEDDAYLMAPTNLGKFVYQNANTEIAYQGGGVWRKTDGSAALVSPPEFHYQGATLTLPVILVRGRASGSGHISATAMAGTSSPIFPQPDTQFPNRCEESGTDEPFINPIVDGTVIVRIESEYATAWGRYFTARTEGAIRYPKEGVVTVELVSVGQIGDFGMPGEGSSISISGTSGGHSTRSFSIRLRPDDTDAANFQNLQWAMYVEEGQQQLELHLSKSGSDGCGDGTTSLTADLDIYYSADGGASYHAWHKDSAFDAKCADLNSDGDYEIYLTADFVDDADGDGTFVDVESNDPQLEYTDKSGLNNLVYYSIAGSATNVDPVTFEGHGDWEPASYDANVGDKETVDRLINHYFGELPAEFELTVDDKGSDTINEGSSSGHIEVGGTARFVNYLHVTKSEVTIELH